MIGTARATYDVGGVLLERPFKVRRLGHFGLNAWRMEECLRFYARRGDESNFVASRQSRRSRAGQTNELYYGMEQIGWDAQPEVYGGETLLGPLG